MRYRLIPPGNRNTTALRVRSRYSHMLIVWEHFTFGSVNALKIFIPVSVITIPWYIIEHLVQFSITLPVIIQFYQVALYCVATWLSWGRYNVLLIHARLRDGFVYLISFVIVSKNLIFINQLFYVPISSLILKFNVMQEFINDW